MSEFNGGDIIFQITMFLFLILIIGGSIYFIKNIIFGRKKQLDRIEAMLKEQQKDRK
ncbi:hypothetical protein [Jeotgalibacillus soli]|uniref:DUF4083 domain-containing protein n=1 Tax=Jeotgalibacillus soli TaxID=889306 RepID=A0A0C2W7S5_9BACL|nr:hypothetical protein [Jeotgalibacillus soli]KIL52068.1 hypothetical protein KP78_04380 [Jeotgalibacillus soli]